MKVTGETEKPVDMGYLITAMEIFMKVNLTMTRRTEEVAIITKMDLNFRAIGKMIINKAMVEKSGKMVLTMKDILTRV